MKSKCIAPLLTAALVFNSLNPFTVFGKEASDETLDVNSIVYDELDTIKELESDVDYVGDEGTFEAESEEEAMKIAESYGAELVSFENRMAIVKFKNGLQNALEENLYSESISTEIIPNYILECYDDVEEVTDIVESEATCNDPKIGDQWHHEKINTFKAWDTTAGAGAKVAVLDNGFFTRHEDFPKIVDTYNVGDGSKDVSALSSSINQYMHGTHVVGIIAAMSNNSKGGAGIAPDVDMYLVKIHDGNNISISNLIRGLNYAIDKKVDVINISAGSSRLSMAAVNMLQSTIDKAVDAGITVVASAGNSGVSTENYPSACDGVVAVAAIDSNDSLANYSDYGEWVDIAAPGTNIYSTVPPSGNTASISRYEKSSGTSMASPMVAGVAALIYANNPSLIDENTETSAKKVTAKLLSSTDGKTYKHNAHSVVGCIDAEKAVNGEALDTGNTADFSIMTSDGVITKGGTYWISPKNTIKFTIVDENGNKIKEANKKGAAKYSITNSTDFSLKNNKLKCHKNSTSYPYSGGTAVKSYQNVAKTILDIEYNNQTVRLKFIALDPIKKIGYMNDGRIRNSITIKTDVGTTISMDNINYLCDADVNYYSKAKSGMVSAGSIDEIGYAYKVSKKAEKNGLVTVNSKGKLLAYKPNKKGTYTITLTALGGSKKKFKIKIKAV